MAILSDVDIKKYLDEEKIEIYPIKDEKQIQPSSVDLRNTSGNFPVHILNSSFSFSRCLVNFNTFC